MRIVMSTLGSHGDVHPFLAIGRELRARGHEAVLITNPYFEPHARDAGVPLEPFGEAVSIKDLLDRHANSMHALQGPKVVIRDMLLPLVPQIFETTARLVRDWKPDLVLAHPLCFASAWACEKPGVPWAIANLAPITWYNPNDMLVMVPYRSHAPSRRAVGFDLWLGRWVMRFMLDGKLNRLRRDVGLAPGRRLFMSTAVGGAVNLGLWSAHFRPPMRDDPPTGVICGFPWWDRAREQESDFTAIERFLNDGEPPIVFTLGTAAVHTAGRFYAHAVEACRMLGKRGVMLVGKDQPPPGNLPSGVASFTYAPYSMLLPRAAATVHHGGIGTTAQALRAGRPTVVVPLAHDQFDNAARVKRLGVSETLRHARVTPRKLVAALRSVLDDDACARRARELGRAVSAEDGATAAADALNARVASNAHGPSEGLGPRKT